MKNEILYILLPDFASHEMVYPMGFRCLNWLIYLGVIYVLLLTSCTAKTEKSMSLKEQLYAIVDTVPGTVGIAFISEVDTVTVNNNVHYPMMSVFKLHQALAVAAEINNRGSSIDSLIHVSKNELDSETWSPMLKMYEDSDFDISIRDLIKYSLTVSDNNASNLLFKHIVSPSVTDTLIRSISDVPTFSILYSEDEMKKNHSLAYLNYSTPLSAAALIRQVFDSTVTTNSAIDSIRKDLATVTTGLDRLGAIIPEHPELFFAHKTGSGYRNDTNELIAHNDVGYFRLPDGRVYALAVFIRDFSGTEAEASEIIARISREVYECFANQPELEGI
ncbi:MAG: class A beta-lactamase-related serine hydrolase [Muribaculaceae bacterium]|nr:class A beta-lactamase-related serine hydrolase [Muribaculaceae bacterium]